MVGSGNKKTKIHRKGAKGAKNLNFQFPPPAVIEKI